ncbi:hypothetical protein NC652_025144 [Populus alba x Populus x berolinensis]|nr:hypothetical protein NC652_025144 [Populus alba x Populus x berolinensis]
MRFSEDFLLPAPGEWLKLDDALWEWRRCPSSEVESKCPLMAEPELPSGGLFSVDILGIGSHKFLDHSDFFWTDGYDI